jgi:hypothetical protein
MNVQPPKGGRSGPGRTSADQVDAVVVTPGVTCRAGAPKCESVCPSVLRHGRDVHPAWVNVVTAALALKSFGGQVTRAEIMLR